MDQLFLEILAPAKVNLLLKVQAKFTNGYHALNSLIARTDLNDRLEISLAPNGTGQIEFSCEFSEMLKMHYQNSNEECLKDIAKLSSQENLAVKAAKLFIEHFKLGTDLSLRIKLYKRIPFGAGLGGGSANAAAVINALYGMIAVQASTAEMLTLAMKLGADVPAMLFEQMVFVEGMGEKVSLLKDSGKQQDFEHFPCIILKPCFSSPTKLAYQMIPQSFDLQILDEKQEVKLSPESTRLLDVISPGIRKLYLEQTPYNYLTFSRQEDTSPQRKSGYLEKYLALFENDFEKIAYARDLRYQDYLNKLESLGALKVLLAGSGSSLVAFMPSWEQACEKAKQASQIFPEATFITPARVFL